MEEIKAFNIYKLNIYQVLTLCLKRDSAPSASRNDFREISHRYPTGFSQSNFVIIIIIIIINFILIWHK